MVVTSLICLLIVLPTTYLLFKYKKRQKDLLKIQEKDREKIFSCDKTVLKYKEQIEHNKQIIEVLNRSLQARAQEEAATGLRTKEPSIVCPKRTSD